MCDRRLPYTESHHTLKHWHWQNRPARMCLLQYYCSCPSIQQQSHYPYWSPTKNRHSLHFCSCASYRIVRSAMHWTGYWQPRGSGQSFGFCDSWNLRSRTTFGWRVRNTRFLPDRNSYESYPIHQTPPHHSGKQVQKRHWPWSDASIRYLQDWSTW